MVGAIFSNLLCTSSGNLDEPKITSGSNSNIFSKFGLIFSPIDSALSVTEAYSSGTCHQQQ